ncbi:uncharacterized protein LOC125654825 isoform X5 [Ostrea edulis]|uniref:uncharacterized protein LOC125654825 isoform X5 n=1 Tax=Ostrea edulis TaxID=37623 RepID=UPI0024AFBB99|nr:uncharacterized protein LOC125654825 isoform X5 [Ostrea edulis]
MDEPANRLRQALEKFIRHVDDLIDEEDPAGNGFHREYRDLREIAAHHKENETFPANWGKQPYNTKKNRYRDIVPFDDSRVTIDEIEGEEGSDYINASYIQNVHKSDAYIASQGPLPTTVDDFWRMVWEQRVRVILMACKEVEVGKKKCARYWPNSQDEDIQYGTIHLHLQEENWFADDCVERTLEVKREGENDRRIVSQFQYTGWPDHGIPDDIDVILTMIAKMREIRSRDKSFDPVVVHCSAGCGRTGTICAVDYSWDVLKCGKLDCDFHLYEIVREMREQRQSMIQTPDQYEMAHRCVRELFQQHIEALDGNIYANFEPSPGNDEYYNVDLDGHTDPNKEVDPYEMVGIGENQPTFKLAKDSPSTSAIISILERDALQTIDMYSTPKAFEEALEDLQKAAESAPRRASHPKPNLKPKPAFVPEPKDGGKPAGYENVCDDGKYENMNKSDHLKFHHEQSSPKIAKKEKPAILHKKLEDHPKTGPVFEESVKSGYQFESSNSKSGPVFQKTHSSKPGSHEMSSNTNSFPPTVSSRPGHQFEPPANIKSGPQFQESTNARSGPQFSQPMTGPSESSDPSKPKVSYRQTSIESAPKNKTVITIGSQSRISYIDNVDDGKTNSSVNQTRNSKGLTQTNEEFYDKAKPQISERSSSHEPALYSQVQKTAPFSKSLGPATACNDNMYETITGENYAKKRSSDSKIGSSVRSDTYSEVDIAKMDLSNAPPIPNRGYKTEDPAVQVPSAHTIHGLTTLERKSAGLFKGNNSALSKVKHNIKDKLNIGNNNEEKEVLLHVINRNLKEVLLHVRNRNLKEVLLHVRNRNLKEVLLHVRNRNLKEVLLHVRNRNLKEVLFTCEKQKLKGSALTCEKQKLKGSAFTCKKQKLKGSALTCEKQKLKGSALTCKKQKLKGSVLI